MTAAVHAHDLVRVHPGTRIDNRDLGGQVLTVAAVTPTGLDLTEWTGAPVLRLAAADVDLLTRGVIR